MNYEVIKNAGLMIAKIGAGVGVNQTVSSMCKAVLPPATNGVQSVCQGLGMVGMTGAVCDMVNDHFDRTVASIEQCVKSIKEAKKPKKEAEA